MQKLNCTNEKNANLAVILNRNYVTSAISFFKKKKKFICFKTGDKKSITRITRKHHIIFLCFKSIYLFRAPLIRVPPTVQLIEMIEGDLNGWQNTSEWVFFEFGAMKGSLKNMNTCLWKMLSEPPPPLNLLNEGPCVAAEGGVSDLGVIFCT